MAVEERAGMSERRCARPKTSWLWLLLVSLFLGACASSKPPMNLPERFEGTVAVDAYYAETVWIEWKQSGSQLTGTYRYLPSSRRLKPFSGQVSATTAGDQLQLTLKIPLEAQQAMVFPTELKCDMKITPRGPNITQLGGFLDFKSGDRQMHRMLTMISTSGSPTPSPKP